MKVVLLAALSLMVSSAALAGEGHNHEAALEPAPHGGILRDATPYKAELVISGEKASIYVYDKDLKPAKLTAQSLDGQVRFPKSKKDQKVTFTKAGEAFGATIKGIGKVRRFDMHVTLNEAGKATIMDFGIDNIH